MDYRKLSQDAAEYAAAHADVETKFYALGQRDAYATVAQFGDADSQMEFLQSCVKSADSERDRLREELAALKAAIVDHAGQAVLNAWTLEITRNRLAS